MQRRRTSVSGSASISIHYFLAPSVGLVIALLAAYIMRLQNSTETQPQHSTILSPSSSDTEHQQPSASIPSVMNHPGPLDGGFARYERGQLTSESGEKLATYAWIPESSDNSSTVADSALRATILLLHGFRSHARYNFLDSSFAALHTYATTTEPDATAQNNLSSFSNSSFVRELNMIGVACYAHDHVGHGASTGLRAYFPSRHILVADALLHARQIKASHPHLPLFVMGHSLGGTLAVLTVLQDPDLFAGMLLSSAATEPPKDMLGLKGQILSRVSALGSLLFPTLVVLDLPRNTREPHMQALFDADPLNCKVQLRARVGHEILQAYEDIAKSVPNVSVPYISLSGRYDTLVDPEASTRFYERSRSTDKTVHILENWHNILIESGKEANWKRFSDWIAERI